LTKTIHRSAITGQILEYWIPVKGYEGLYEISNIGNVRSMLRTVISSKGILMTFKARNLKTLLHPTGYLVTQLSINGDSKAQYIHKLMAKSFLNHNPNGNKIVVDHINNIKTDNRIENLQIITQRENVSKDKKGSSKYTGVSFHKGSGVFRARINLGNKAIFLGNFNNEYEAHLAYQKELSKPIYQ